MQQQKFRLGFGRASGLVEPKGPPASEPGGLDSSPSSTTYTDLFGAQASHLYNEDDNPLLVCP